MQKKPIHLLVDDLLAACPVPNRDDELDTLKKSYYTLVVDLLESLNGFKAFVLNCLLGGR